MHGKEHQSPGEPDSGFKVTPKGAETAHKFLKIMNMASEMPMDLLKDKEPDLSLGSVDVHNTLVHLVAPQLIYMPDGFYEIRTAIATHSPQRSSGLYSSRFGRELGSSSLSRLLGLGDFDSSGEISDLLSGRRTTGNLPVTLAELAETLRRRPHLRGYEVDYSHEADEIKIIPPLTTSGTDKENSYLIMARQVPALGAIYHLENLKAQIESDPNVFSMRYNLYAKLLEELILSMYQANHTKSPDTILNFAPPADAGTRLRRMEKALNMGKRQLSAAGLIENGDDEDIEKRIVMEKPNVKFDDVGGQERAKVELSDVVAGLKDPQEFYAEGAVPPTGVMLYGPSGTGKTLLARATASEADATIFSVGLASILHSLWGKTERYIQRIFDKAQEQAPSIIFFDEIDAIARQRSSLNQAYSSIVNVLLTNMDGMQERASNVVVIGATNLLDLVDDALLRPGRFDLLVPVELPDDVARAQVFNIHKLQALSRATRLEDEIFDPEFDLDKFVAKTKGFSGADIKEVLRRGLVERVRLRRRGLAPLPMTADDLIEQIAQYETVRKDKASRVNRVIGFQSQSRD